MRRGFTLAELLVAFVFVAAGLLSVLLAYSASLQVSASVEQTGLALQIANAELEMICANGYSSAPAGPVDAGTIFSGITGYTIGVNVTAGTPARVDVTISWPAQGGTAQVGLTTLVADS